MGLLVYSPLIELFITTQTGTYDVSGDIVSASLNIQENATPTFSVNLLNKGRRYDRIFAPDDTFEIYLTRLNRLLIMCGYLDQVPYFTAWPMTVTITGEASTKRLLYHYWDPTLPTSMALIASSDNNSQSANDTSLQTTAQNLLTQVGGWDPAQIHIGVLPSDWFSKIGSLYNSISQQWALLGGTATINGQNPLSISTISDSSAPNGAGLPFTFAVPQIFQYVKPPLDPYDIQPVTTPYYCQMQWGYRDYNGNSIAGVNTTSVKQYLAKKNIVIINPNNNQACVCEIVGWGPLNTTNGNIGVSQAVLDVLQLTGDNNYCSVGFELDSAVASNPPGPFVYLSDTSTGATLGSDGSIDYAQVANLPNTPAQVTVGSSSAAQSAINYCIANENKPYRWGGGRPINGQPQSAYDCSSYVANAYYSTYGASIGPNTVTQFENNGLATISSWDQIEPGDLIYYNFPKDGAAPNHVAMYYNAVPGATIYNGSNSAVSGNIPSTYYVLEAPNSQESTGLHQEGPQYIYGIKRLALNSKGASLVGSNTGTASSSSTSSSAYTGTATPISIIDWYGQGVNALAESLGGIRALINDTPLLPMIQTIMQASMRSWCAGPDGSFIGWFPDYFGIYGTAAIMTIAPIELQNFAIYWNDQNMVTHQFAAGSATTVNNGSGFSSSPGGDVTATQEIITQGIVTIDYTQVLQALFNLPPNDSSGFGNAQAILNRFGARPNYVPMGTIVGPLAEFWYALYLFQYNWASQFSTTIDLTFMPELYPGMLIQITELGFQCYVTQVQHNINLASGGGFTTTVTVIAPAAINGSSIGVNGESQLFGLPTGGKKAI